MSKNINGWRERAGLPASYEITNPSAVERALLEEVAELRKERCAALMRLGGAIKMVVNMLSRDNTPVRIEAAGALIAAFGEVAEQTYGSEASA